MRRLFDWLHARTGHRDVLRALLEEPLPPGTAWLFTLGSVLLALLAVQLLTGAFLTLYYAPTPDHAYDSVRYIAGWPAGRLVRGLHHFGASFLVVATVIHMLRVIVLGSYKAPREVTWLSGLALFGIILAFALTGYLLPWDQRAYWGTVVTINIARLAPAGGEAVANLLQGGASVGALTLTRWYAVHVIFLPTALVLLMIAHLVFMRRQGSSGPLRPRSGPPSVFYPVQAARDVAVILVVLLALTVCAWTLEPPLAAPADPSDATYVPRPEWYFLGLFQLLKYFPGRWEVVGAIILPTLLGALLALLPWLDRAPERDPRRRPVVMGLTALVLAAVTGLTILGWRDMPESTAAAGQWTLREIGGRQFVANAGCARCHDDGGMADPIDQLPASRAPEWIAGHIADPEMIAPGLREPPGTLSEREAAAIVAYVSRAARSPYPGFDRQTEIAAAVYARLCIGCHVVGGEGGHDGPALTRIGAKLPEPAIRQYIADPEAVNPDAEMPAFGRRLSTAELEAISRFLAALR